MELAGLAGKYDQIRARGALLYAVTADDLAVAKKDAATLPFPILSADVATLGRWGLLDDRADIARPAWLIIDPDGKVRRAWFPDSQRTGVSPDELLRAL
jgi:peroxiredoxin